MLPQLSCFLKAQLQTLTKVLFHAIPCPLVGCFPTILIRNILHPLTYFGFSLVPLLIYEVIKTISQFGVQKRREDRALLFLASIISLLSPSCRLNLLFLIPCIVISFLLNLTQKLFIPVSLILFLDLRRSLLQNLSLLLLLFLQNSRRTLNLLRSKSCRSHLPFLHGLCLPFLAFLIKQIVIQLFT